MSGERHEPNNLFEPVPDKVSMRSLYKPELFIVSKWKNASPRNFRGQVAYREIYVVDTEVAGLNLLSRIQYKSLKLERELVLC